MNKLIAALLAAAALTPAAHAQNREWRRQGEPVNDRGQAGESRGLRFGARGEARGQFQAPAQAQTAPAQPPVQAAQFQRGPDRQRPSFQGWSDGQPGWQGRSWRGGDGQPGFQGRSDGQRFQPPVVQQQDQRQDAFRRDRGPFQPSQQGNWTRRDEGGVNVVRQSGDGRGAEGRRWDGRRDQARPGVNGFGYNPGWRGGDNRFSGRTDWNRTWRNDNRYNWNRYRTSNRSAFRLPRYYAPYDWNYGYRRFSIGVSLFEPLWAQDYWIDDPFAYRLPPAYGPYRWVRYYNDALLVDIRDGVVVDTVYDIFW